MCFLTLLLSVLCLPASAYNWVPTHNGSGIFSPDIGPDEIIGWKTMYFTSCLNATDTDYYYNGSIWIADSDNVTFLWTSNGLGTPGNPTGSYTGFMNIATAGVVPSVVERSGTA